MLTLPTSPCKYSRHPGVGNRITITKVDYLIEINKKELKRINSIFHANIACPETSWLKFTIKTDRDR
jgi:hypothetical protein